MLDDSVVEFVDATLDMYRHDLTEDYQMYRNHVLRVLSFLACLHGSEVTRGVPSHEVQVAAIFHDIGIWTDHSLDYLGPSTVRAMRYLDDNTSDGIDRDLVQTLITNHHKVRPAGEADSLVEIFRRADLVDVTHGIIRFSISRDQIHGIASRYPYLGFQSFLARSLLRNAARSPRRPFPMLRF